MARISARAGKWTNVLGVILLAALALFAWNYYPGLIQSPASAPPVSEGLTPRQIYYGPANSIAVLPFGDDSPESGQSIQAIGFSAELHRLLTRTPGLRITSLNSSFYFRDGETALPVIAERLHVSNLVTGEVHIGSGHIRVGARLFDARKSQETWSAEYQGRVEEAFAILDKLLGSIANSVNRKSDRGLPEASPVDAKAWDYYLQGLYFRQQRSPVGFEHAASAFRSALDVAPEYPLARAGLAGAWLAGSAAAGLDPALIEDARDVLAAALEIEPDLPEALGLMAHIRQQYDWDFQGALESAERAVQLNPGDPELMSSASLAMFSLGRFDAAGDLLEAAVGQDPLNLSRRLRLGLLQEFSGDYDAALTSYRLILGLNPEFPAASAYRARVKILQDNPGSALRESGLETSPFWKRYSKILALSALDRHGEADELLDQMIREDGHRAAYQVAEVFAFRGETEAAFEWLGRARDQQDGGLREIIGNRFLQKLHDDARWEELMVRLGLPLDSDR